MRLLIVSGFLGSGKTTILMELLGHMVAVSGNESGQPSVVVIENEVGDVSIDDKILESTGLDVRNLFSGCVCCTLSGQLVPSLREIERTLDPEWVVLETTGIASVGSIMDTIHEYAGLESKALIIVDASRWMRIRKPLELVLESQLKGASVALINKCDLVEDPAQIAEVEADVQSIEPEMHVYRTGREMPISDDALKDILA